MIDFFQVIQETEDDREQKQREIFAWGRRRNVSSFGKLKEEGMAVDSKCLCGRWVRGEGCGLQVRMQGLSRVVEVGHSH